MIKKTKKVIEHLRSKPDRQKKAIAFGVSISVTLAIFLIWAVSFYQTELSPKVAESSMYEKVSPISSFFGEVKSQFVKMKASAGEPLGELKNAFNGRFGF